MGTGTDGMALFRAVTAAGTGLTAASAAATTKIVSASGDDVGMGNGAVTAAPMEGVLATTAAINALFLEEEALAAASVGADGGAGLDLLDRLYRIRLDRLGLEAQLDAQVAALKARDAAIAVELQDATTPPDASVQERTFIETSVVEEMAGILTISAGAAGAFIAQARRVCSLPFVRGNLSSGALSWQGAKIIADETEALHHTAAVALADHLPDPDAPNPARGCRATALVPSRLRARVRAWRERHHPDSIEKRNAKSVADRRVEFHRDRDGMAWISAYLPAGSATAIWNKNTATARGLQGPNETRTLPQIKADEFARRLLAPAQAITTTTDAVAGSGSGRTTPAAGGEGASPFEPGGTGELIPNNRIGLATLLGPTSPPPTSAFRTTLPYTPGTI